MNYVIKTMHTHVEVFDLQGNFICSADNWSEAQREIEELLIIA